MKTNGTLDWVLDSDMDSRRPDDLAYPCILPRAK